MHSLVYLNGKLMEAARARTSPIAPASLYGRGVFTTLAVYKGRPFLWPEHLARLTAHAARMGLDRNDWDDENLTSALHEIIEANHVENGRARVTLLDNNAASGFWNVKSRATRKTDLLIVTGDARARNQDGLALTVSPYRANTLSPLVGLKSTNYLEHLLAWEEARGRDFDEAVRLNERGEIVSAIMANIFWVHDGALHTPALSTGALAGTTRACVITLANELSVPVVEGVAELSELGDADEIFLTSAGLGVEIVTTFDFHRYTVAVGSIALRLREAFRQLTMRGD